MHDLHDLLARREAAGDVLAERPLLHGRDELLHDLEVDVGLEQREADLARGPRDVLLGEAAATFEVSEGGLKLVGKRVEHGPVSVARRFFPLPRGGPGCRTSPRS